MSQLRTDLNATDLDAPETSRRRLLGGLWAIAGLGPAVATLSACGGGSAAEADSTSLDAGSGVSTIAIAQADTDVSAQRWQPHPAALGLGGHDLAYNRDGAAVVPLSTSRMATRAIGSTLLACVGRGVISTQTNPRDNKGNTFVQADTSHVYTLWPNSGTALYVCERAAGGLGHVVAAAKPDATDETTLSVVEIVGGGVLQDLKWSEVLAGHPLRSQSVTTSGPAVLVAWWWGDADVNFNKTAVPDNGFVVVNSILLEGALVQCAVAVRKVDAAGTYDVTWIATPVQGAQLWIAAVQSLV